MDENCDQDGEPVIEDWEGSEDKFATRITGDSMTDEHIIDGDFVVIRKQNSASDGQIIAFRGDDGELTLRRIFREKGRVRLEPANKTMKADFRDQIDIIGVLVGVVRKY